MFSFENGLSFIMFVGNKLVLKLEVADEPNQLHLAIRQKKPLYTLSPESSQLNHAVVFKSLFSNFGMIV